MAIFMRSKGNRPYLVNAKGEKWFAEEMERQLNEYLELEACSFKFDVIVEPETEDSDFVFFKVIPKRSKYLTAYTFSLNDNGLGHIEWFMWKKFGVKIQWNGTRNIFTVAGI